MPEYKENIDEIVKYFNNQVEELAEEYEIKYVDLFDSLYYNDYFSNPLDIHPNKLGYEVIAKEIYKKIEY